MKSILLIAIFVLACNNLQAQSSLTPTWIEMPEETALERRDKRKARLAWAKRVRTYQGIARGQAIRNAPKLGYNPFRTVYPPSRYYPGAYRYRNYSYYGRSYSRRIRYPGGSVYYRMPY